MKYVHISTRVDSRIENLKQVGKSGKVLAHKATRIIESLASGDLRHHMDAVGSYTKYGEKRIKNCRKYDLGCGYRLITLQRGQCVFVPFLGTHDECQRWLENNSRLKQFDAGKGTLVRISRDLQPPSHPTDPDPSVLEEDPVDELLMTLSDTDLRRLFCGLVEAAGKRTS